MWKKRTATDEQRSRGGCEATWWKGRKAKTTSGEDPASTPSCLLARNIRCGARRGWGKGTSLLDIALTERETEAECPDLLGGF